MFLYATKKDAPRPFGPTPLVQLLGRISDKSASISIVCKMKKRAPFGNYEFNSNTQIIPGYLKQLLPQNIVEMNSTKPELKTNKFLSLPSTPPTWLTFQHLPPPTLSGPWVPRRCLSRHPSSQKGQKPGVSPRPGLVRSSYCWWKKSEEATKS